MTAKIDDLKKIELKVGEILKAEAVPDSVKLVQLSVDLGEDAPRQIIAGIAPYFSDLASLVNKKFAFVSNLEPRMIMGLESQGMILAASGEENLSLLSIDQSIPVGSLIR